MHIIFYILFIVFVNRPILFRNNIKKAISLYPRGGGGRLGSNYARMGVSKSEGHGFYHGWGSQSLFSHRKRIGGLCPGSGHNLRTWVLFQLQAKGVK